MLEIVQNDRRSHRSYRAWHSVRTVAARLSGNFVPERDDESIAMEFYMFVAETLDKSEPQGCGINGARYVGSLYA